MTRQREKQNLFNGILMLQSKRLISISGILKCQGYQNVGDTPNFKIAHILGM